MNIDEKIKRELQQQRAEVDNILAEERGLSDFILGSVRSSLKGWFIVINVIVLVVSGGMLWAGYQFFNAMTVENQNFWAVCFITLLIVQVALKQWLWAEMSRNSIMREIKRVEWTLTRALAQQQKVD